MVQRLTRFLPHLQSEPPAKRWMGFRPSIPDSLPVIGPAGKDRRVIYAFGHGHYGLTQAAITSRLVADSNRTEAHRHGLEAVYGAALLRSLNERVFRRGVTAALTLYAAARQSLRERFATLHRKVLVTVRDDDVCRRLMTIPVSVLWCRWPLAPQSTFRRGSRIPRQSAPLWGSRRFSTSPARAIGSDASHCAATP